MPQVILSLVYRGFQCSTIRFDFLRNYTQVLSRTWKKLEKDSKCIPFPKGGKKIKGKNVSKDPVLFFFHSLKRNHTHTNGCPLKVPPQRLGWDWTGRKKFLLQSCQCNMHFPEFLASGNRERAGLPGLQIYHQSQCGKSSHLHSVLPF